MTYMYSKKKLFETTTAKEHWWEQYGKWLSKKATIHQVTTMLATSENVLFPGHNHPLTTGTDDPSLAGAQAIIKMSGHQYRWLAGGYDLERGHF